MHAVKQDAIEIIDQLPDDADMDEIMYRLYALDKVRKAQEAVEEGKTVTDDEMKRDIDAW